MGRPDSASGEDVIVGCAQRVYGGDDRALLVPHHADLGEPDAERGELAGEIGDVHVLGPAREYLVADDDQGGGDGGLRHGDNAR